MLELYVSSTTINIIFVSTWRDDESSRLVVTGTDRGIHETGVCSSCVTCLSLPSGVSYSSFVREKHVVCFSTLLRMPKRHYAPCHVSQICSHNVRL